MRRASLKDAIWLGPSIALMYINVVVVYKKMMTLTYERMNLTLWGDTAQALSAEPACCCTTGPEGNEKPMKIDYHR